MSRSLRLLLLLPALMLAACVTTPEAPDAVHRPDADAERRATPTPVCSDIGSPAFVICQFYSRYITLHPRGLPDDATARVLQPFLSSSLLTLLNDASERADEFSGRILFSGGDVMPDAFSVLNVRTFRGPEGSSWALVSIQLEDGERRQRWIDEAVVRQGPDGYRIEEFVLRPADRNGGPPNTLRRQLGDGGL
ncbi:hypothetical protein [Isoalcanivorax beigongshangi]|uniref:Lipoprotein n=1 Tax=Isoalcanivorax beigongshangi TaxID=3238810 RepID=A0ABV4AEN3_9GAMM